MMKLSLLNICAASFLFLALSGCGGGGSSFGPDRGEGSIPVGRAVSLDSRETSVMLRIGEWQRELTSTPNGVVYAPSSMPDGAWELTVARDGHFTERFSLSPTNDKAEQFDVTLLPTASQGEVSSVRFDHPGGITLRVGESLKLKVVLEGSNVRGKQVSLWTSGGIGSVNAGGVLKGKAIGTGTVTADAFGISATAAVTVVP